MESNKYAKEVKAKWGNTDAYREFSEKSSGRTKATDDIIASGLMAIFDDFGKIRDTSPDSTEAQCLVKKLQDYITENFYTCTPEILDSLGRMYSAGGEFTANIDAAGGEGTARFAAQAISVYCK